MNTKNKVKSHKDIIFKCNTCNSTELEENVWQDMNTGEILDHVGADTKGYYCRKCKKEVQIIIEQK